MKIVLLTVWRIGLLFYLLAPIGILFNLISQGGKYPWSAILAAATLGALAITSAFFHSLGFRTLHHPQAWQLGWGLPAITTGVFLLIYFSGPG